MTEIEIRREVTARPEPDYAGQTWSEEGIKSQQHRRYVGGLWEELGKLQVDFLAEQGLRPHHQFIDVGCGSLRAGRLLVDYLEPRHYYGIDINVDVMKAGYDHELTDEQRSRLPLVNLRCTDRFDADFGHPFDMAIAQSVFTHLSLNNIRLCLFRLAKVMKPGAKFFATFFEEAAGVPLDTVKKGERFTERNVFWYYRSDLRWASRLSPWEFNYIGDWGHPRGQRMLEFTRKADG